MKQIMLTILIMLLLQISVAVMHGTATKLQNARKIKLDGAVSGEASFNGSQDVAINVTQNNITVVSGSIDISASDIQGTFNGRGEVTISYPTGYTKNNCKILSISTSMPAMGIYSTGSVPKSITADIQKGMVPTYASRDTNLRITAYNALTQAITMNYEIILIKVL